MQKDKSDLLTSQILDPLALITAITAKMGIGRMEHEAIIHPMPIAHPGYLYSPLLYVGSL